MSEDHQNIHNYGNIRNQKYTQHNYYTGHDPTRNLAAARDALKRHDWDIAVKHYADHIAHARDPAGVVFVEYALADLQGKRPRDHPDGHLGRVRTRLDNAYGDDPALPCAAALLAIIDEDLNHLHRQEPELYTQRLSSAADAISPDRAKMIVDAITVDESPTWLKLERLANPGKTGGTGELALLDEEEQRDRERRMRTLFSPPPREPDPPYRLSHSTAVLGLSVALATLVITLLVLRQVAYAWSPFSPLPYVMILAIAGTICCAGWIVATAIRNAAMERRHDTAVREQKQRHREYLDELPTADQIDRWLRGDLATIQHRALDRLGILRGELVTGTGRYISPFVIMGPEEQKSSRTKMAQHPNGRFFASRYGVFVLFMTERKLGAYRTTLDAITGRREAAEQTSEYRYGDIVSVSVRTVPLPTPGKKARRRAKQAEPEQNKEDEDYTFVDVGSTPTTPLAERFTLIVPSDRFDVTTTIRDENSAKDYRIQLSQTDRALAAIRRNILAAGPAGRRAV
ncbi:hypothetical protein [Nonomuraea sp. NPDC048916]|uniref:hypothetical protein n=1 Tax=Nonomuraea sp. NPDC048916 TaxID=3154232 RepID=UPI0033E0E52E